MEQCPSVWWFCWRTRSLGDLFKVLLVEPSGRWFILVFPLRIHEVAGWLEIACLLFKKRKHASSARRDGKRMSAYVTYGWPEMAASAVVFYCSWMEIRFMPLCWRASCFTYTVKNVCRRICPVPRRYSLFVKSSAYCTRVYDNCELHRCSI